MARPLRTRLSLYQDAIANTANMLLGQHFLENTKNTVSETGNTVQKITDAPN